MTAKLPRCTLLLWGVSGQKPPPTLPIDRDSPWEERTFDPGLSQRYGGAEFDYSVDRGESMNLLARAVQWFFRTMGELFGVEVSPDTLIILEYLVYVILGFLALYLLVRMLAHERFGSLFTKKARAIGQVELCLRHIEEVDLDALLTGAVHGGDYRLAVRYRYLKVLKQLSERGIIDWHHEKTNMDYLGEMPQVPLQQAFQGAIHLFENIWYGQRPIDARGYQMAERRFDALTQLIP